MQHTGRKADRKAYGYQSVSAISYKSRAESSHPRQGSVIDLP